MKDELGCYEVYTAPPLDWSVERCFRSRGKTTRGSKDNDLAYNGGGIWGRDLTTDIHWIRCGARWRKAKFGEFLAQFCLANRQSLASRHPGVSASARQRVEQRPGGRQTRVDPQRLPRLRRRLVVAPQLPQHQGQAGMHAGRLRPQRQ